MSASPDERQARVELLWRTRVFRDLDRAALEQVVEQVVQQTVEPGEVLCRQGDEGHCAWFVMHGRLQVLVRSADGREVAVEEVGRAESVGELALLANAPRSATVRAIRHTRLLRLEGSSLSQILERSPATALHMLRTLALRMASPGAQVRPPVESVALYLAHSGLSGSVRALVRELSGIGSCEFLDRDGFVDEFGCEPDSANASPALGQLASEVDFVVYATDADHPAWSRLAFRHADRIVIAVDPTAPAEPTPAERAALDGVDPSRVSLLLVQPEGSMQPATPQLGPRDVTAVVHVERGSKRDHARLARTLSGRELGLVLGGGGARGLAHIGVLKALEEGGHTVDTIGGCSMGAFVAALYARGESPDAIARICGEVWGDMRFSREYHPPFHSLLQGRLLTTRVAEALGRVRIEDLRIPYFCVASNLTTAALEIYTRGSLAPAVLGSGAIPPVAPPRVQDGELIVDGGLLNNIPVDVMRDRCRGTVIGVDVSSSEQVRADPGVSEVPSGWAVLRDTVVPGRRPPRLPTVVELAYRAGTLSSIRNNKAIAHCADLWIRPDVGDYRTFGFEALDAIVERGYVAATAALKSLET